MHIHECTYMHFPALYVFPNGGLLVVFFLAFFSSTSMKQTMPWENYLQNLLVLHNSRLEKLCNQEWTQQ